MLAPGAVRLVGPVAALLALAVALLGLFGPARGPVGVGLTVVVAAVLVFLVVFFRDPDRVAGDGVVSAADGRVLAVERTEGRWVVSVFLSVLDVHVNRLPLDATVDAIETSGRGFRPAYRPDAGANVQRRYRLRTEIGPVEVVQITGIAARRLVSFVGPGSVGRKGERFGMIVLGSRTDVLLPADRVVPTVRVGDRVRGGASTIARIVP
ncbi:MAG TPA: phosphatidylserine decarboxylase [Thermoplasmata archaeon]|nr:phosphatidylserine decarboxylase [Thermoplasmata archaeon]